MADLKQLQGSYKAYKAAIKSTGEKRIQWEEKQEKLKKLLEGIFHEELKIDCSIGTNEYDFVPVETLTVKLPEIRGYNVDDLFKGINIKTGATLNFKPTYEGKIVCWMGFPSFGDLKHPYPNTEIYTNLKELEIKPEIIYEIASIFFEYLMAWESEERAIY